MKYRKWVISIIIFVLILGISYWLSIYIHPKPNQPLDSPEVYRGYLNSDSMASRKAAMILLAAHGDPQRTKTLIDYYSQPTSASFSWYGRDLCIAYFKDIDTNRVSPELIDKLIELDKEALQLIPKGREQEHLTIINKLIEQGFANYYFTGIIEQLNDRKLFSKYHLSLQKRYQNVKRDIPYTDWVRIYFSLYSTNPMKGYGSINREFPEVVQNKLKWAYGRLLVEKGYYKEAIDVWLLLNQDTTQRWWLTTPFLIHWDEIPEMQKARFSESDRKMLIVEFEKTYKHHSRKHTRDELVEMLNHPTRNLWKAIQDRIDAGDKDLRPLLLKKALVSKDGELLFPVTSAFKNKLGGIPPELRKHIQDLCPDKAKAAKEIFRENQLIAYLNDTVYRELSIPWILRRWQVNQAVAEIKQIDKAIDSYFAMCSMYPNRMEILLSPIGHLSKPYADRCGVSGPYAYYSDFDLFNYIIASTGPDGVWNISTKHYLLYRLLGGVGKKVSPLDPLYVKCDTKGNYTFLTKFEPGCDIAYILEDFQ